MEAASTRKQHARDLFSALPRHYDLVGALMSFGQDPRWRRALVDTVRPSDTDRVLDVATGTGLVSERLALRYGCTVIGIDQSPEMLGASRARLARNPRLSSRVSLVEGEAERLPFGDGEFDHLTFTYLLRYVDDPTATLRELARVVAPGGRIASLEFGVPTQRLLRALWVMHTRVGLPVVGRLFSREWASTGAFLARSVPEFYARYPITQLVADWQAAGIDSVKVRRMSFGAGLIVSGTRGTGQTAGMTVAGSETRGGEEPGGHAQPA
jgi:demethylmenaquinone methyltransferase/2-methoxy-6-polyprenyl-1,4-benzoquinol methylase